MHVCLCFRGQGKFQSDPDSYNGAVRENYSWSQDYTDVEVRVLVPKTVIKGRQVNTRRLFYHLTLQEYCFPSHTCCPTGCSQVSVSLQASSIKVCVRDGAEETTLMEGEFTHKINTENSLWSLEPGSCVVVSVHTHTQTHCT